MQKENTEFCKAVVPEEEREQIERLRLAVVEMDEDEAKDSAEKIVRQGGNIPIAIENGLIAGMETVAKYYEEEEYFIPEVLMCADAMYAGLNILKPAMPVINKNNDRPTVVIGAIYGDTHDIGKNIVAIFLEGCGFRVINLGRDVLPECFVDKAIEYHADIIAVSTLMTTTMDNIGDVIHVLKERGIREQFKVMVGGRPLSPKFARKIGADGYSRDAREAVELARSLIRK